MSLGKRAVVVVVLLAVVGLVPPVRAYFGGPPGRYWVGAATRDITPEGEINIGGNGLGDGSSGIPAEGLDKAHRNRAVEEHIMVRALVVADESGDAAAIADIETQGMFAAYKGGGNYGLSDMAREVARRVPALSTERIIIASDHTHSGPDTIGAWGFVPEAYMQHIFTSAVDAIVDAYERRVESVLVFGTSRADDLVYNQNCTEALNQSPEPAYPGPQTCNVPDQGDKDALVRVLQARAVADDAVVTTFVSYNAHSTLGGGNGVHGDWPQFLSERLTEVYGGTGIAMEGAVGRVQPCRPQCSFTNPAQFGDATTRRGKYINALMSHVTEALVNPAAVQGPGVFGRQRIIREPITSPAVLALFAGGKNLGAELRRSDQAPWMTGTVIGTPVSTLAFGNLLISGFPGEAYPNISLGVQASLVKPKLFIPLGLANDQLGYLISPAEAWPMVTAEVAVNDNSIFNVSQTIGDHVMCASIANADEFYAVTMPPRCAAFAAMDSASTSLPG